MGYLDAMVYGIRPVDEFARTVHVYSRGTSEYFGPSKATGGAKG